MRIGYNNSDNNNDNNNSVNILTMHILYLYYYCYYVQCEKCVFGTICMQYFSLHYIVYTFYGRAIIHKYFSYLVKKKKKKLYIYNIIICAMHIGFIYKIQRKVSAILYGAQSVPLLLP
jgi:hypothetical protein